MVPVIFQFPSFFLSCGICLYWFHGCCCFYINILFLLGMRSRIFVSLVTRFCGNSSFSGTLESLNSRFGRLAEPNLMSFCDLFCDPFSNRRIEKFYITASLQAGTINFFWFITAAISANISLIS